MLVPWAILVVVVALCGTGAWWGHQTLTALQGDLQQAERLGDESQRVIRELESRAQVLEDRGWFDLEIPLDDYAGREILLEIASSTALPIGANPLMGGWGTPTLVAHERSEAGR